MYLETKTGLNKQPNIIGKKYPKKIEIRNTVRISSFKKNLIFLDISFEQASKFIVSAGTSDINQSFFEYIISALSCNFTKKSNLSNNFPT